MQKVGSGSRKWCCTAYDILQGVYQIEELGVWSMLATLQDHWKVKTCHSFLMSSKEQKEFGKHVFVQDNLRLTCVACKPKRYF